MKCMRGSVYLFLASLLFLPSETLTAQTPDKTENVPEIKALRINPTPPVIDGNLDEPLWHKTELQLARDFTQMEPDEGKPATESTLVAVAYDDGAIYFAFWCYDSEPEKIIRQLVRRDRWVDADLVTIRLDPYHDHRTGYRFEINASGVQRDMRLYDDVNSDNAWDGVWESAVKMQPWGWTAEVRIPYHCLRFGEKDDHTWGLNVTRYIPRKTETSWWAFSPSTEGGHVARFGHVTGLSGINPASHMEILPYVVSSLETAPKSLGNPDGKDYLGNTGFDLKYALTSNLILDATINPDFGQVELDSPVLNLTAFETYFDEKRPFFLEGSDLFSTNFMLFYSRRIGRTPWRDVDDDNIDYYTDYPKSTTILGAAKMTGKLPGGTSIGFINAVTEEEKAKYVDANQDTKSGIVEPVGNYSVFRVKQDVFDNSSIGMTLTNVTQDMTHPSTTGGVDWRLNTNNGNWGIDGQVVFSRVDNEDVGLGFTANINKNAGSHWRGSIGGTIKDPNLQINRLGYTSRNDFRHASAWVQYRTQDDWFIVRNSYHNINGYVSWNYHGDNIERGWNYNNYIEFTNYWTFGGGFNMGYETYSDVETRGNGLWQWPEKSSWSWWANLDSDVRKKVSITLNPGSGIGRDGTWWAHYTGITYRPKSNIELGVGANYKRNFNEIRWVENRGDTAVFATLNKDEIQPNFSISFMAHRDLSIQLSAEAIMAGLDYNEAKKYDGGNTYTRLPDIDEATYDYNFTTLNSTLIIRWEYLPGSTLYVVWTRIRPETDDGVHDFEFSRDVKRLFSAGSENVFLIKASYWWNI